MHVFHTYLCQITNLKIKILFTYTNQLEIFLKSMAAHRDISGILQKFRDFFVGRKMHIPLRFSDQLAPR